MEDQPNNSLPDIQSTEDVRNIPINRVGVRNVALPVVIEDAGVLQNSVARLTMTVSLPGNRKGTHMSRFIGLMEESDEPLCPNVVSRIARRMLSELQAAEGTIEIRFPFFLRKAAPVSRRESLMNYECAWIVNASDSTVAVEQETLTPVTSLCPCSKEISDYGAHNQRSHVLCRILLAGDMSLREQIEICEAAGSSPLWARLKREDEKFVTQYAYDHPKFVEDIVRDVAKSLDADDRICAYRVESENFESIHNHSAYAWIARDKRRS